MEPLALPIYRVSLVREGALSYPNVPQMRNSKDVAQVLQEYLKDTDREHFVVFFLASIRASATPDPSVRGTHTSAPEERGVRGLRYHAVWPKVADTVIEAFFLDQKNRLTGIHTVSMGSMTASVVHPRESYKAAILAQAAAIVCGHNHPSGDVQPSREDRALTTRLFQAGKLLGINMLDHIIIGHNNYFSFADEGLLDVKEG